MNVVIEVIAQIVRDIVSPVGLLMVALLNYRLARQTSEKTRPSHTLLPQGSLRETIAFVALVASIAFFVTLITQYVYPPYGVYAPSDYKPLISRQMIKVVWILGLTGLLFLLGVPKIVLNMWGAANIRERVAQGLAIGVPIAIARVLAALLLRR